MISESLKCVLNFEIKYQMMMKRVLIEEDIVSMRRRGRDEFNCQQMCRQPRREKMELRSVIYGWAIWWSKYTTVQSCCLIC